jgi:methyl-accepting chemotaxis protein
VVVGVGSPGQTDEFLFNFFCRVADVGPRDLLPADRELIVLSRLSVKSRLLLTIVLPLLTIMGLAAAAFPTFSAVKINGDQYIRISKAKDIEADILPPPAFMIESMLSISLVLEATDQPSVDRASARIDELKQDFKASHARWYKYLKTNDPLRGALLQASTTGDELFREYEGGLKPRLQRKFVGTEEERLAATEEARAVYFGRLLPMYNAHKRAIDEAVILSNDQQVSLERETKVLIRNNLLTLAGVAAFLFALVGMIASLVARSINRPIRVLTKDAERTASEELPNTVARIQAGEIVDATHSRSKISKDRSELGALARSFDAMHDTAIDLASEQARVRRNVADNLINVGRRNQSLLKRSLSHLTKLEQDERDPNRLDRLFKVDHLTMRMRRNAESLLVLASAEVTRAWSQSLAVDEVVRSALSQIESYDRVSLGSIAAAKLRGYAVQDVAHIFAELLENATYFSPPQSNVMVTGAMRVDGYFVTIADEGVGMTEREFEAANRRLNNPQDFDAEPTKVLGLTVTGRLGKRHGIEMHLTSNDGSGVSAQILIPPSLLDGNESEGRAAVLQRRADSSADYEVPSVGATRDASADPNELVQRPRGGYKEGDALPTRKREYQSSSSAPSTSSSPEAMTSSATSVDVMEPLPVASTATTQALPKRVRGASGSTPTVSLGPKRSETSPPSPTPENQAGERRSSLSSLQSGIASARTNSNETEE